MNTLPNALELFESSVKESLYSCFCLFVVSCGCCFLFSFVFVFAFCFVLYFTNRKEEEWHIAKRSEL